MQLWNYQYELDWLNILFWASKDNYHCSFYLARYRSIAWLRGGKFAKFEILVDLEFLKLLCDLKIVIILREEGSNGKFLITENIRRLFNLQFCVEDCSAEKRSRWTLEGRETILKPLTLSIFLSGYICASAWCTEFWKNFMKTILVQNILHFRNENWGCTLEWVGGTSKDLGKNFADKIQNFQIFKLKKKFLTFCTIEQWRKGLDFSKKNLGVFRWFF